MKTVGTIADGDRTTATGLYNLAESYRLAADRIRASKAKPLRFESPSIGADTREPDRDALPLI
jgi:hypothetical protein